MMSIYSMELRTLIHECLIINPYRRPAPPEVFRRTQQAVGITNVKSGLNAGPQNTVFAPYTDPVLSARWYSGQIHNNLTAQSSPTTPKQIAAADILHNEKINLEREKLKRGASQVRVSNIPPPPPYIQNIAPTTPTPAPKTTPSSGLSPIPATNTPSMENPPSSASVIRRFVLHNITQVTCIVQSKNFFGTHLFKSYTIKNVTPETLVLTSKEFLADMGCEIPRDKQIWMLGRTLMADFVKLGEFEKLANGRGIVRISSK
ncbi:hypothetical protein ONS95_007543 [Cadophora gregata]|uniref:uncharacterized protein n=1 Tax=Cadophora gregata TaxID=51156 RepID=UPI0026DD9EC7|nr:uncharacterized protein ONS95_007543 [Cadophora gregata]KAK0125919.1 hypothetical protein ONS95_007543 [Cadophora gregata]